MAFMIATISPMRRNPKLSTLLSTHSWGPDLYLQLPTQDMWLVISKPIVKDFPADAKDKNLPANARETGSIPGPVRFHMLRSK